MYLLAAKRTDVETHGGRAECGHRCSRIWFHPKRRSPSYSCVVGCRSQPATAVLSFTYGTSVIFGGASASSWLRGAASTNWLECRTSCPRKDLRSWMVKGVLHTSRVLTLSSCFCDKNVVPTHVSGGERAQQQERRDTDTPFHRCGDDIYLEIC